MQEHACRHCTKFLALTLGPNSSHTLQLVHMHLSFHTAADYRSLRSHQDITTMLLLITGVLPEAAAVAQTADVVNKAVAALKQQSTLAGNCQPARLLVSIMQPKGAVPEMTPSTTSC